jgi:hypothetical protein
MVVNPNMSNHLLCSSGAKRRTCDAGLGREKNQGEATDWERAITIAPKQDVFCIADLAKLSLVNKNLKGEIRQDHVWRPFLHTNRLGFGNAGIVIDDSEWPDKNIPPLATLMLPPRIRGPIGPRSSVFYDFSHPEGHIARTRFNPETGVIEDLFKSVDGLSGSCVPRAVPIQCFTCDNGSFENYPDFVKHLKSSGYIRKMTRERHEIPEEWYDPRLYDDFDTMACFEQVHDLFEFKAKILRKLREPMSAFVVHRMDCVLQMLCRLHDIQNILDSTDIRASALQRLIRVVTDVAEESFTHHGVKGYCLAFLKDFESIVLDDGDIETNFRMVEAIQKG